jgi:hypothetical protein
MIATWAIITGLLRIVFALFVKNLPEHVGNRLDAAR